MANITKIDNTATWNLIGEGANTSKVEEALKQVGLDFKVEKRGIFFGPDMKKITDKYATVRTDKEESLGIVGKGYEICENEKAFSFADYISKELKFVRGGMTYTGLCWVVAEMPSVKILGEDYTPCLVLQNSFNGKYCLRANICALHGATGSQINLAMNGISDTITIKHLASLPGRMKKGQETLAGVSAYMDALKKVAEKWAEVKMDKEQIEMFLDVLFPLRKDMSETVKARVDAQRKMFLSCYDDAGNKTNYGNAWGLIKAYADYNTHTMNSTRKGAADKKFLGTTLSNFGFKSFLKKLEGVTGKKIA